MWFLFFIYIVKSLKKKFSHVFFFHLHFLHKLFLHRFFIFYGFMQLYLIFKWWICLPICLSNTFLEISNSIFFHQFHYICKLFRCFSYSFYSYIFHLHPLIIVDSLLFLWFFSYLSIFLFDYHLYIFLCHIFEQMFIKFYMTNKMKFGCLKIIEYDKCSYFWLYKLM